MKAIYVATVLALTEGAQLGEADEPTIPFKTEQSQVYADGHTLMKTAMLCLNDNRFFDAQKPGRAAIQWMLANGNQDPELSRMIAVQARIETEMGNHRDAVALYQLAQKLDRGSLTTREQLVIDCNTAMCFRELRRFEAAETIYSELLEPVRKAFGETAYGLQLVAFAKLKLAEGKAVDAAKTLQTASSFFCDEFPTPYLLAKSEMCLTTDVDQAKSLLEMAVQRCRKHSEFNDVTYVRCLERLAHVYVACGEAKKARSTIREATSKLSITVGANHARVLGMRELRDALDEAPPASK